MYFQEEGYEQREKDMSKREKKELGKVKDQRTFLRLPFAFLWLFYLFFSAVRSSMNLFPCHLVSNPLPAYCFANRLSL